MNINHSVPLTLVGILTWNKKDKLRRCLKSVERMEGDFDVLVVDNGSTDNTHEMVKKEFPLFSLISLPKNLGAAGGRNVIIRYFLEKGDWDYLFFLDDDAVVENDTLEEMVKVAEKEKAGVVGAKVLYYTQPEVLWCAGGSYIDWKRGRFYGSRQKEIDRKEDFSYEVDTTPIGFSLVSRKSIEEAGLIDERFFIYYEETDWHVRMKKKGIKVFYAPRARIMHMVSSSLGFESPSFYYYRIRNRLLFMWKNTGKINFLIFFLYFLWDFSYNTLLTLYLNGKRRQLVYSLLGFFDFLIGRFGKRV